MSRRRGYFFKSYKEYKVYLLDNGLLLFYNVDKNAIKNEDKALRIQLDETLRLNKESRKNEQEQFVIRLHGKSAVHLQAFENDAWVDELTNLRIKR